MAKKSQYQHKLDYNNAYNRNNYRMFSARFNIKSEKDIIEWLEKQEGVKDYLKHLIEADMKKKNKRSANKTSQKSKTKKKGK